MSETTPDSSNQPSLQTILAIGIVLLLIACGLLIWKTMQPDNSHLLVQAEWEQRVGELIVERDQARQEATDSAASIASLKEKIEALQRDNDMLRTNLAGKDRTLEKMEKDRAKTEEELRKKLGGMQAEVSRSKDGLKIELADRIFFTSGSAVLTSDGRAALRQLAQSLMENQKQSILVIGHTDNIPMGRQVRSLIPSNRALSAARAVAAVDYLQQLGIAPDRLAAVGMGEASPVADNATEEGRSKNRRIEVMLPDAGELPF